MRTWTLAFLAMATLAALAGAVGFDSALQFAARLLFLVAVVTALLAGIRSAALQMADGSGDLPAHCTRRRAQRAGGRRREDALVRLESRAPRADASRSASPRRENAAGVRNAPADPQAKWR